MSQEYACSPPGHSPLPAWALRIASLLKVWWLRHPAGVPAAALSGRPGLPPQRGSRPATVGGVARPTPVPLFSWLPPSKASQCNAAGLLRQGQASLRSVLRSLDTRPAALGPVAKGESQEKNRRGPAAEAAERPRRACQAQGNLDYPPGRAFAVTNAGRKSQGKNSLQ
jgi:hypothetical protein